jgi:hypothetical protein
MGYPEDVEKCFFAKNKGLSRRFPYRYKIDSYTPNELFEIFSYQVVNNNYKLNNKEEIRRFLTEFLTTNKSKITDNGGDMEFLLTVAKIQRSANIFGVSEGMTSKEKFTISLDEIRIATEKLLDHKNNISNLNSTAHLSLYI